MASLDASNKSEGTRPSGRRFIRTEEMKFAWRLNRAKILEVTLRYAFNGKKVCYYGSDSFSSKTLLIEPNLI